MNTVLQARPRNFVSTPTLERTAFRALRYLRSGYSVHLKGPAGTGKTTLALHLADLLGRPIMLLFGDDEFKTSDLIGNQSGYTRKKVVDNYIHSVMKVEDELRHNWIDSRLTLACREGFTLVYDEFNRSRPEVNNVLLSALEEKLLVLPPNQNRSEYIRVNPHFRAIFTSNPEEYCGVHGTQDALQDRLITINMPEPDELAQQQILVQKVGLDPSAALQIVRLVKAFQSEAAPDMVSSLRPSLMIATICNDHSIPPLAENADFRDVCSDVLIDRSKHPLPEATRLLWDLFNHFVVSQVGFAEELKATQDSQRPAARLHGEDDESGEPLSTPPSPPVTEAPVVEDLVVEEPVAEESVAEAPVTEDLAVEEPIVEDLVVEEPVGIASEILAEPERLTEAPLAAAINAVAAPTPLPEAPVTEVSLNEASLAETAVAEDALVTASPLEELFIEEPLPEESFIEEPFIEEPFIDEPFNGEPFAEESFVEESFVEEPFVEEPFVEEAFMDESPVELSSTPELAASPEPEAFIAVPQAPQAVEARFPQELALDPLGDPAPLAAANPPVAPAAIPNPVSLEAPLAHQGNGRGAEITSAPMVSATLEATAPGVATPTPSLPSPASLSSNAFETSIFDFLAAVGSASLARIESDLGLTRFQVVNALKSMLDQGLIEKGDEGQLPSVYQIRPDRG